MIEKLLKKIIVECSKFSMNNVWKGRSKAVVLTGDYISLKMMLEGWFEKRELETLKREVFPRCSKDSYCLDIGANIGNHSLFFSGWFKKVYAFEPNSEVFDVLALNAKRNGKIFPEPVGASSKNFIANAISPEGNFGGAKIIDSNAFEAEGLLNFNCVRLDDYLPEEVILNLTFIKLDIEGHEYDALLGCQKILKASKPIIAFEILRKNFDESGSRIHKLLLKFGYENFHEVSSKLIKIHKLEKRNYKMLVAW